MSACRQDSLIARRRGLARGAGVLLLLLGLAGLLLSAGGCGGKGGNEGLVLATVGDIPITKGYYEERLSKLEAAELPRDENGYPLDTSTEGGKLAFLDVIINKELMAAKARQMGYDKEDQISGAAKAMMEYHAGTALHKDLIEAPANKVSEEELQEYYKNLGEVRKCSFLITNFYDDALKARQEVIDGRLWDDVANEYHDGSKSPSGTYQIPLQWGRYDDSFENAVFSLKEGEISMPVETVYGWWLLRLDGTEQTEKRPLEEIRDRVLTSIRMRKINLSRKKFMEESRAKHDVKVDEDALWIVYQGLPEGEVMLDPVTKQPTPREELKPLDIAVTDMDKFMYQVRLDGKLQVSTVGDYKLAFDAMNVFQRPKRTDMLGGLRSKIYEAIDRQLIVQEAQERGYMDKPVVRDEVNDKVEEMMVTKLFNDVVSYDKQVTPEQVSTYYDEHTANFVVPEARKGHVVFCADEAAGQAAAAAAREGADWDDLLGQYDSNRANLDRKGETDLYRADGSDPVKDALFSLSQESDVSDPFAVNEQWAVVRLDEIQPAHQQSLEDVTEQIGQVIRAQRQDQSLKQLLAEWRGDFSVVIHKDRLAKLRSWEDLAGSSVQ
jgi:parvulin-like peptidyl-prolyl isomerase